jgi:hypothetical protein
MIGSCQALDREMPRPGAVPKIHCRRVDRTALKFARHRPTGVGKSWITCALGQKACRDDRSVLHHRVPRLFDALALARGDGRYARRTWHAPICGPRQLGPCPAHPEQARDLLEIIDDRHGRGSTIVTSQLPVDH